MRPLLLASLLAATAAASPALAQSVDRYGGGTAYAAPAPATRSPQPGPARVLSWPGKTIPAAAQPQVSAYTGAYRPTPQPQPYGPPPPQAYYPPAQAAPMAGYPSGLQPQPYYAPQPGAPAPTPGSTATAPSGVYPPNTVPPQFASPMAVPPQMAAPLVDNPPLPTSIYAPPRAAAPPRQLGPAEPRPTRVAAAPTAPAQGARLYSLHREFGLSPDPTPPAPANDGQGLELVSSIDSGGPPDPAAESGTTVRTRRTDAKGNTVTRTARLRGAADTDD